MSSNLQTGPLILLNRLNIIEFLEFKQKPELADEIITKRTRKEYISLKSREITNLFDEFLIYGGYPAVVLESSIDYKKQVLFELRDSWLKRDVLEADVRNETEFFNLMAVLADQAGARRQYTSDARPK